MAELKDTLATIVKSLGKHGDVLNKLKQDNEMIKEIITVIHQNTDDLGKKIDEFLNTGIGKPVAPAKKPDSKPSEPTNNIRMWFLFQYVKDPDTFKNIFEKNQVKSILKEEETKINAFASKNNAAKFNKHKAGIIYSKLSKDQIKKVRAMLDKRKKELDNKENSKKEQNSEVTKEGDDSD